MKLIILLLCLISFALFVFSAQGYKHKSKDGLAHMTPGQHIDEWVKEQVHHRYDVLDEQKNVIRKYIRIDGLKTLPRIIEIIDEYDPTLASGKSGYKEERFDAVLMLLDDLDNYVIRLRGTEEGKRAIDALELIINRMRKAGYSQKDQVEWAKYSRFDFTLKNLEWIKGVGEIDDNVKDTLWVRYKILLSKEELLAFSNFLVTRDSSYPSWSETDFVKDYTRINEAGNPLQVYLLRKPERYYEAYLEFKKMKQ